MKRTIPILGAALFMAACSEPTAVNSSVEPALRAPAATWSGASFTFSGSGTTSTGYSLSPSNVTTSPSGEAFLGQFTNQNVTLQVPAGASNIHLSFNLYIIGTWDGYGGKKYGTDSWSISATCVGSTRVLNSFTTDFSNKVTTKQHYPNASTGALNPGLSNVATTNALGFQVGAVHGSGSANDAEYLLTFDVAASSCSNGVNIVFKSPSQQIQSVTDESWGLDNIVVSGS
jgi:hypothetical protein